MRKKPIQGESKNAESKQIKTRFDNNKGSEKKKGRGRGGATSWRQVTNN